MSDKTYPNAFLFGMVNGAMVQAFSRFHTMEPLSARPFTYLRMGLAFGVAFSYYDWWRRCALQDVLEAEDRRDYWKNVRAANKSVRLGEEEDILHLTDYMAGTTTRI